MPSPAKVGASAAVFVLTAIVASVVVLILQYIARPILLAVLTALFLRPIHLGIKAKFANLLRELSVKKTSPADDTAPLGFDVRLAAAAPAAAPTPVAAGQSGDGDVNCGGGDGRNAGNRRADAAAERGPSVGAPGASALLHTSPGASSMTAAESGVYSVGTPAGFGANSVSGDARVDLSGREGGSFRQPVLEPAGGDDDAAAPAGPAAAAPAIAITAGAAGEHDVNDEQEEDGDHSRSGDHDEDDHHRGSAHDDDNNDDDGGGGDDAYGSGGGDAVVFGPSSSSSSPGRLAAAAPKPIETSQFVVAVLLRLGFCAVYRHALDILEAAPSLGTLAGQWRSYAPAVVGVVFIGLHELATADGGG
jgi:hypothetical protein